MQSIELLQGGKYFYTQYISNKYDCGSNINNMRGIPVLLNA